MKELIKKVLKEELNESTFFRRRVDMDLLEKEFYENLNYATNIFLERYNEGETTTFSKFKKRVIDYLIDNYNSELTNGGLEDYPYDEVYNFLSDYFHNKIKERYDEVFGEDINEPLNENKNKFNPVRFFYEQYLNQQPLYFEDLILHPTYDGTKIMWNIENPNDRSFNYGVLDGVIGDEFKTFCVMINGDYQKYNRFVRGFYDKPRNNCYLNDEDRSKINQILKNKKEFRCDSNSNQFFIDLDYKSFEIKTHSDEIDFYGYFNFNKIYKYDSQGNNEEIITRREFFNDFGDIIDEWNEGLYSFFDKVLLVLTSNKAFFDNDYDYFNLNLE